MKKAIITAAILGALASNAFSQGLVYFSGGGSAATRISTNSVVGGSSAGTTSLGAGQYYYALFASAANTTVSGNSAAFSGSGNGTYVFNALSGWTLVGFASSTANAGRFGAISQGTSDANQGALNSDGSLTVQGIAGAANANFVAIGWSANIGSTLAALEAWYANPTLAGWIGESIVGAGESLGDNNLVSTPQAFGVGAGQLTGFLLGEVSPTAVPEPTTMALAGLGAGALLLFRRRK